MLPALGRRRRTEDEIQSEDDAIHTVIAAHDLGAPALAKNLGWLKLIGEPRTEQTTRQLTRPRQLPQSDEGKAHQARRKRARAIARSRRKGMFGLLRAIQSA